MENINNNESEESNTKILYNAISIACISIAVCARIFTPGWWLFEIILLGPIHAILFISSNYNLSRFVNKSIIAKVVFWLQCLTYVMVYVLLPDLDDINEYAIGGLIQDAKVIDILVNLFK